MPPDRHHDVTREVDLIEEVARVHGIDEHLPSTLPAVGQAGGLRRDQRLRRRAEDALRDLGFDEIVGWSFTDPGEAARLRIPAEDPRAQPVVISNPLSEDQSVMRTTLVGSLLGAAERNQSPRRRPHRPLRVRPHLPAADGPKIESDSTNRPVDPLGGGFAGEMGAPFVEAHRLGALAVGALTPGSWRGGAVAADFYSLKGVLEGVAARLGVALGFEPAGEPFLHPGRSARRARRRDARPAGSASCTRSSAGSGTSRAPRASKSISPPWSRAPRRARRRFEDVTTFPSVRQDLAVVVPTDVSAAEVRSAVLAGGGELLREAAVFDLFEGEQLGEGRKSLALRLEFRAADRTLTDEEVATRRGSIVAALKQIGGAPRE